MTERDPLAELEKALFEAGRRERPADEVRSRVREAARGAGVESVVHLRKGGEASSRRSILAALGLAAVAALAFFLVLRDHRAPAIDLSPEGASAHRFPLAPVELRSTAAVPSAPPPVRELEVEPNNRRTPRGRSARPSAEAHGLAPAPRPAASLPEEIEALDRARTALNVADPTQALRTLDEYDQVLHGTTLKAEATLLRIEALARSGQTAKASELARRFVASNPGSPLAERARRFMETESLGEDEAVDMGGKGGSQ
jgi:hypothetical protein